MEKRFSKQGYHINEIKKYGEILGLLICELIIMNPRKKPNKYAPLSPSIKIFEIFKSKRSSNRINIRSINLSEIIKLSTKPKFIKKYKTINVQEINSPFKPSIKLLPLTKMSKQNVVKKYAKIVLFKMISNNSILDEAILRSIIITNEKINIL